MQSPFAMNMDAVNVKGISGNTDQDGVIVDDDGKRAARLEDKRGTEDVNVANILTYRSHAGVLGSFWQRRRSFPRNTGRIDQGYSLPNSTGRRTAAVLVGSSIGLFGVRWLTHHVRMAPNPGFAKQKKVQLLSPSFSLAL